jgi:polyisoprenoid-binding protein YceI
MTTTSTTATRSFVIDPAHSTANFWIRHLMIAKVRGSFSSLAGTIALPADSNIPTSITAEIDATTIDTRDAQRDGHLKSPDFFDVATHPKMTFESTEITALGATTFKAAGTLTIHGVSAPVTLDVEVSGEGKDPYGNHRIAFEASTKLSRKDFGLTFNIPLDAGGVAIGDDVNITLDIETIPKPA